MDLRAAQTPSRRLSSKVGSSKRAKAASLKPAEVNRLRKSIHCQEHVKEGNAHAVAAALAVDLVGSFSYPLRCRCP